MVRDSGRPLAVPVKEEMEARFGADLADVRLHVGPAADRSAAALGARAYTSGSHVVIGKGGGDKHTLAHELTHVIQQRHGLVAGTGGLTISDPSDRFEQEAEAAANRTLSGPAAPPARTPSVAAAGVVQRALDHSKQGAVGFGAETETPGTPGSGVRVKRAWLRTDGSVTGSEPFQDPEGYGYIRSLHLTNFWIRFHLVNNLAGGPGSSNNLVPASKRDNSQYEKTIESHLKDDVDDAETNGEEVFFGVEVDYSTVPPLTATARQQQNAPFFPTSLQVFHEKYDTGTSAWVKDGQNGQHFIFADREPTDTANPVAITALTLTELTNRVPGYGWDADDVAFLNSLGGVRRTEFEGAIDKYSGEGAALAVEYAFNDMTFSTPTAVTGKRVHAAKASFYERITGQKNGDKALVALSGLIAQGAIYL